MAVIFTRGPKRVLNYVSGTDEVWSQAGLCAGIGGLLTKWVMHMGMWVFDWPWTGLPNTAAVRWLLFVHTPRTVHGLALTISAIALFSRSSLLKLHEGRSWTERFTEPSLSIKKLTEHLLGTRAQRYLSLSNVHKQHIHYSKEAISLNHRLLTIKSPDGERMKSWSMNIKPSA